MTAFTDFVTRVRVALGVSDSYEAVVIPAALREQIRYFLRGWNFPKSLTRKETAALAFGVQEVTMPDQAKKLNLVMLKDDTSTPATYKEIQRADSFRLPAIDGVPAYYWLTGTKIYLDTPTPQAGLKLQMWYQSLDPELAEDWMLVEYGDVLFFRTVFAMAADMRKKDVQAAYGPLWGEAKGDLAVFVNELEFDKVEINMRDAAALKQRTYSRYPT